MSTANTQVAGLTASTHPVVLVHGWNGGWANMAPVGRALEKALSVKAFYFDYRAHNTNWASVPEIASCLAAYVNAVGSAYRQVGGNGKVIVVAHSMGGLAVRFSASASFAATPDAQALGGVVTIDTPYLGSPFGNQSVSRAIEALPLLRAGHPTSLFEPKTGTDASICLAAHEPPANALPAGCALAPYLPAGVPLTELAGDMSVRRTLFGIPLYTVDLGTDGPVPVTSAQGYFQSGPGGRDPSHRHLETPTVACTVGYDEVASAAAQGLVGAVTGGVLGSLAGLLTPSIFTDIQALDQLQSGKNGLAVDSFLVAAYIQAPCSHSGMLTDPSSLADVIAAVRGDIAALNAGSGQTIPISATGAIGPLQTGVSTRADVLAFAGTPDYDAHGREVAGGPTSAFEVLGYGCRVLQPTANDLSLIYVSGISGQHACETLFYIDSSSGKLVVFATASSRYRDAHGIGVGMPTAQASALSGQVAVVGCLTGLRFGSTRARLTEVIDGEGKPTTRNTPGGGTELVATKGHVGAIYIVATSDQLGVYDCIDS
jgi:pimeloyl-ACP methyl ester carboxylesterase